MTYNACYYCYCYQVFLSLQVRVDPDWRGSVDALTKYGYIESDFA